MIASDSRRGAGEIVAFSCPARSTRLALKPAGFREELLRTGDCSKYMAWQRPYFAGVAASSAEPGLKSQVPAPSASLMYLNLLAAIMPDG
jgi:hypothetical protein